MCAGMPTRRAEEELQMLVINFRALFYIKRSRTLPIDTGAGAIGLIFRCYSPERKAKALRGARKH